MVDVFKRTVHFGTPLWSTFLYILLSEIIQRTNKAVQILYLQLELCTRASCLQAHSASWNPPKAIASVYIVVRDYVTYTKLFLSIYS